jgi:SAM-dependent methyltransferase
MKNLKTKFYKFTHQPLIIRDIIESKLYSPKYERESQEFITHLKKTTPYYVNPADKQKLNTLCSIESWKNEEVRNTINEIRKDPRFIERKDWEWALGLIAMKRFGKINKNCTALGVGAGSERVIFYLANTLRHVYATDLYEKKWQVAAPSDFPENPSKYAPFPYSEDALTVLRMDGTKLEFPSEIFDVVFSFSSIEHFGGKNHSGALKSLREMERVLKPQGIAIIATEYIINDKEHHEWFNRHTIYADLIDKLELLSLVEPLDLRITTPTLDTVLEYYSGALEWQLRDDSFKKSHPEILVRYKNTLYTSLMLVFQRPDRAVGL